jgi:PAS domain S-box-containing protein
VERPQGRHALAVAVLLLGVAVAAWVGIAFTAQTNRVATVWLANGLVAAVVLGVPCRNWPTYLLGSLAVYAAVDALNGDSIATAVMLPAINVFEILVTVLSLRWRLGRMPDLSGQRNFVTFLLIGGVLAPAAAGLLAATWLQAALSQPFAETFLTWFAADALGMIVTVPTMLCLLRGDVARLFTESSWQSVLAQLATATAVILAVFLQSRYPLLFFVPLVLIPVVSSLGMAGASLLVPILTTAALGSTGLGTGPLTLNPAIGLHERLLLAQLVVATFVLLAYMAASMVKIRQQAVSALLSERAKLVDSEQRLARSETQFRLLAEHASDMVSRVGPDGAQLYVSPAAARIFGISPEALLGQNLLERVIPEDRPVLKAVMQRLLSGEAEESDVLYRVVNPERGEIWIEGKARVLRDPVTGAPVGYTAISRDVTERRRLEAEQDLRRQELERYSTELELLAGHLVRAKDEAERANRAKSRFLAGVSHELRTPLNGLLGYAQLLRLEGGLSAIQSSRVEAMLGAGAHLLEMINRVLDLSDIEAERIELQVDVVDVGQVARGCLDLVRPMAQEKGLLLEVDAPQSVPCQARTDATRLRQVLLGLLDNALKYTVRGSVVLRLQLIANGAALRVEVADTGPGIPAEQRRNLFLDCDQPGNGSSAAGSAGLGLPFSARLAALLGGRLGYEDNPGGGSVFWLELPLAVDAGAVGPGAVSTEVGVAPEPVASVASSAPAAPGERPASARPTRVLVVDDVAMNRDIANAFLCAAGHEVICADGGAEAVELAGVMDYDVVLMDVRMPEMDGLEATRRIRALPGPRGRVPVIALTAQAFAEQVAECQAAGMDSHLAKPFAPEALLAAVTRAVAIGQARGEAAVRLHVGRDGACDLHR